MLESDADRLARIQALDGQLVRAARGEFWAIFDNDFIEILGEVESRVPALACRTSDIARLAIAKDELIEGLPAPYRVKRTEADGTGMSMVLLKL